MKQQRFSELVGRLVEGTLKNEPESTRLLQVVKRDHEILERLADQVAVDQLLRLASQDPRDHDAFVLACLEKQKQKSRIDAPAACLEDELAWSTPSLELNTSIGDTSAISKTSSIHSPWTYVTFAAVVCGLTLLVGFLVRPAEDNGSALNQSVEIKQKMAATQLARRRETTKPQIEVANDDREPFEQLESASDTPPNDIEAEVARGIDGADRDFENALPKSSVEVQVARNELPPDSRLDDDKVKSLGQIISKRNAQWVGETPVNLNPGTYSLASGCARLKFDNGVLVRLLGPAKFELSDETSMAILHGAALLEISSKNVDFECFAAGQKFSNPRNAAVYIQSKLDGQCESWVARGSVRLTSEHDAGLTLELSKSGLDQVAFVSADPTKKVPQVLVAKGANQFVGQCVGDGRVVTFSQPDNLQYFLGQVVENERIGWDRFVQLAPEFDSRLAHTERNSTPEQFRDLLMQKLRGNIDQENLQNSSDESTTRSTSFQGSLNINGVERKFDSFEEFDAAQRELFGQSRFGRLPDVQVPSVQLEDAAVEVGDKKIQFSTPEMFKRLRRKMN